MKDFTHSFLTVFIVSIFFLSTSAKARSGDGTPVSTATPKSIDSEKVDRAMEFFDKGNQYAEKGLMERAREYWIIASNLDPRLSEDGNASGFMLLGLAEVPATTFKTEDPTKQKRILGFLSKARTANKDNDYDSAMKYIDLANDLSSDEPQVRALRISITLGDFKVDEEGPANPIAKNYFDEAVEYYRHGKFTEALESINQAGELAPRNLQILNFKVIIQEGDSSVLLSKDVQRAREQWEGGNGEISLEILDGVLKKNPQFQPALDLQTEIGKSEDKETSSEVQTTLDQATKDENNNYYPEAKKSYEKVLKIDPKNKIASAGLSRVAGLVDPLPGKIKDLEKALAAGQKRKAMAFLMEIKTLSPKNPEMVFWQKKLSALSRNSVPESDESKADEAYNLGLDSYRNGDLDDAKKFWNQAIELNPQHLQAKRDLERLIEEHPEFK